MGFLTTFTIYNDHADEIMKDPQRFAKDIHDACLGARTHLGPSRSEDISLGCCANGIRVQKPRHADDHAIYIHKGNCLMIMNPNEQETKEMYSNVFDSNLDYMEYTVKELKKIQKARREAEKKKAEEERLSRKTW